MSLSSTYLSRKELLADNLNSMGVTTVDKTDGLTTLINAVLDIEPSTNIDLDIDCTLSASSASITVGESVILTATLLASYDATPASLKTGEITGATILFKDGNTTVGTAYTDNNGTCSVTLSNLAVGSHTIKAVFEGTANFDSADSSTVTVNVGPLFDGITLTSDKNIISYNGGNNPESATLTAQLTNNGSAVGVSGETVTFEVRKASDDSLVETLTGTTNSSGIATVSYLGKGVGDIYIKAECRLFIQTCSIKDIYYYNNATSANNKTDWTKINNVLTSVLSTGTKVYSNTAKEGTYYWNHKFDKNDNFQVEFEYVDGLACAPLFDIALENNLSIQHRVDYDNVEVNSWYFFELTSQHKIFPNITSVRRFFDGRQPVSGDIIKFTRIGTTFKVYLNDIELTSEIINISNDFYLGFSAHSQSGRYVVFKDFKVRIL